MPKLHRIATRDGKHLGYMLQCPGCGSHHAIYTEELSPIGCRWTFDGNLERPTFDPSIRVRWEQGEERIPYICHFFVRAGQIEFCSDSTHELRGKTVALPDWD